MDRGFRLKAPMGTSQVMIWALFSQREIHCNSWLRIQELRYDCFLASTFARQRNFLFRNGPIAAGAESAFVSSKTMSRQRCGGATGGTNRRLEVFVASCKLIVAARGSNIV